MSMDNRPFLFFTLLLTVAAAITGAQADAVVSGTVFCDQCKDGKISLFDYPLNGIKVSLRCPDSNAGLVVRGEDTTNWLGNYVMRFQGTPNIEGCYAQVTGGGGTSGACAAVAGTARSVSLTFRMFDFAMYGVEPLLSEPAQPMSSCPRSVFPVVPPPAIPTPVQPPPFTAPAVPTPPVSLVPPMPSIPFFQSSACPYWNWTSPEYECYWTILSPDSKVAVVFGLEAARKYGTDLTLKEALQGRGDPYKTLLREATTSLLNSYTSVVFPFNPIQVLLETNLALVGSTRHVIHTALRFIHANSGNGQVECKFKPCSLS